MMDKGGSKMIGDWLGKLVAGEAIRLGRKLKMREGYGKRISFEYMVCEVCWNIQIEMSSQQSIILGVQQKSEKEM